MILVVEDDPHVARLIALVLERSGHRSEVVSDGRIALQRAKEAGPSLIFADLSIRGIGGDALCSAIKSQRETRSIPCIVVSGDRDVKRRASAARTITWANLLNSTTSSVWSKSMQRLKAGKPIESPEGSNVVGRLMRRLSDEGFTIDQPMEEWTDYGEIIFRREEKIWIASGETVFIFTRIPELSERILRQTSASVVHTYKAKSPTQKALSVLQSTTVFHCLVCASDQPCNDRLAGYITREGGATFIPVVLVPEINQVLYPQLEERVASILPRIEYLQYLLGERLEPVNMHNPTIQAFYVLVALLAIVLIAILLSVAY